MSQVELNKQIVTTIKIDPKYYNCLTTATQLTISPDALFHDNNDDNTNINIMHICVLIIIIIIIIIIMLVYYSCSHNATTEPTSVTQDSTDTIERN